MWSLLSPYLLLTVALDAVLSWTYTHHSTFGYCSEEEPFLTLRNIPVQTCVTECQLRNACMAVNYWRQRRDCEMLLTDEGPLIQQNASKQVCTFIRKSDIHLLPSRNMTACVACNKYTACNVSSDSCVIKECRMPTVPNASIKGNMLTVGSHIMIDCNQWFVGKARSTCQDNGNWSNIPTCVFEYECKMPPKFPCATALTTIKEDVTNETVVLYGCDTHYAARPGHEDMIIRCEANSTWINSTHNPTTNTASWSKRNFKCVRDCYRPRRINHATASSGPNLENMTKTYSCLPGYVKNGTETTNTTCQADGTWTDVDFECMPGCAEPTAVENATASGGNNSAGATRVVLCNPGYAEQGGSNMTIECQSNGTWTTTDNISCVPVCGALPMVTHAVAESFVDNNGSMSLKYACEQGYAAANTTGAAVQCTSGTWETPNIACLRDCHHPPHIENATSSPGLNLENITKTYSCLPGYVKNGTGITNTTCQLDGHWSTVEFDCIPGCAEPTAVESATLSDGDNTVGTVRTVHCNTGYATQFGSNKSIECQPNGSWTEDNIRCLPVCGALPTVPHAITESSVDNNGSKSLQYVCEQGYATRNTSDAVVQCINDAWESPNMTCLRACAEPAVVENSVISLGDNLEGEVRNYTCKPDHVAILVTSMSVVCQHDGSWTIADFRCVPKFKCPSEEVSFHQAFLLDGTVFQFRAFFDAPREFEVARDKCATEGGGLYQILTIARMNFTLQLMACPAYHSKDFWIDGVFNQYTSVYETTTGTPLPMSLDFWYPNRPNQPGVQNCVWMQALFDHKLDDINCENVATYPNNATYAFCEIL